MDRRRGGRCSSSHTQSSPFRGLPALSSLHFLSLFSLHFCSVYSKPWVVPRVAAAGAVSFHGFALRAVHPQLPCASTARSRKSQSYEPLLLENEREAVADLLQFLESAHLPFTYLETSIHLFSRPNHNQLLSRSTAQRSDDTLLLGQRGSTT